MNKIIALCLAMTIGCALQGQSLLKKLKQQAEKKLEQNVDKKLGINQNQGQQNGNNTTGNTGVAGGGSNNGGGTNNGGAGLISTPPDVNQNLNDAQTAFQKNSYGDARYSVQQAMLGVELEIGNSILKSFPSTINGLNANPKADQVTSTGFGWAGLVIHRQYTNGQSGNSKAFDLDVANNAVWMSAINMYFTSGGFAQQQGGQQNWKQIKFKGYRTIIEFNKSSGYKLSVPIGQSSLLMMDGRSFADEAEMMNACNEVDIDGIKKMLGEQ